MSCGCGFFNGARDNNCLCWIIIIAVVLWFITSCCGSENESPCGC